MYSIGACPVCPGFGEVVVLTSKLDSTVVYYCPACGTAWKQAPAPDRLDEVSSLNDLAPGGVRLATKDEIDRLGLGVIATEPDSYSTLDEIT